MASSNSDYLTDAMLHIWLLLAYHKNQRHSWNADTFRINIFFQTLNFILLIQPKHQLEAWTKIPDTLQTCSLLSLARRHANTLHIITSYLTDTFHIQAPSSHTLDRCKFSCREVKRVSFKWSLANIPQPVLVKICWEYANSESLAKDRDLDKQVFINCRAWAPELVETTSNWNTFLHS